MAFVGAIYPGRKCETRTRNRDQTCANIRYSLQHLSVLDNNPIERDCENTQGLRYDLNYRCACVCVCDCFRRHHCENTERPKPPVLLLPDSQGKVGLCSPSVQPSRNHRNEVQPTDEHTVRYTRR